MPTTTTTSSSSSSSSMDTARLDDSNGESSIFNVVSYGAYGDGQTDDSQAFIKAWKDACGGGSGGTPTYLVPEGKTFFLKPIAFSGPCNSPTIQIQLQGNLVAPSKFDGWSECSTESWISFSDIDGLNLSGSGYLDGRGSIWWYTATPLAQAVRFHNCQGLRVNGLKSMNSPRNHISISNCGDADISNIQLKAPEDSPNTDGIDISDSSNIYIHDSFIGTGDDCIAINGGSSYINITRLACGPGHGISIGSLGANGAKDTVHDIYVQNCTFTGTQNGARIKTWEGGSGYATNITFEDIIVYNIRNPIIIDQHYCNGRHNCPNATTAVQVSNVIYRGFNGTSDDKVAITLDCSKIAPCKDLVFDSINLVPATASSGDQLQAYCENAVGRIVSASTPSLACLDR
ncbi:hypothetical protein Dimus_019363 [Dionaea muscipula]